MTFKNERVSEKIFRDIPLFVEVAKFASMTQASTNLDIPLPTVSRRMSQMEKTLGMPLFHRKSRKTELTEYGQALYERYRFVVAEADAALEDLIEDMSQPRGPVRFSVHPELYLAFLSGVAGKFAARWPGIQLTCQLTARWVDLYTEPFDLDIRAGTLPDSDLKVRKLTTLTAALYATPALLRQYITPENPADLKNIPCISSIQDGGVWLMKKGNVTETAAVRVAHMVDSLSLIIELILASTGVAWLAPFSAAPYVERGDLVPLMPGWTLAGFDISVVMASNKAPKRVRLFVDFLVEHFAEVAVAQKRYNATI